jgi:hypothetical protein
MNDRNDLKVYVSDYCMLLLDQLEAELGCASRSELVELLVLSQVHAPRDAWALVRKRSPRGRRWPVVLPVVLPDDAVLPPEG